MTAVDNRAYLSPAEAAKALGVSTRTIYRAMGTGSLPGWAEGERRAKALEAAQRKAARRARPIQVRSFEV